MSIPHKPRRSLSKRLKIVAVSLLLFLVPSTSLMCCYAPPPPTETPTPTSPVSPLPTPTPTSTPEARRLLLERLLAEGCLPKHVACQLKG